MAAENANAVRARLQAIRQTEREHGRAAAEQALIDFIRDEASTSSDAFLALGRLLTKGQRYDDALRAAMKARSLAPGDIEPLILGGLIELRMKENLAAGEMFAKALQLDRNSSRALLGAAAVKLAEENYDDAQKLCDRVLALDPEMERAYELIARIEMRRGNLAEAIEELKRLVATNPANRRALRAYLGLMKRENRSDEALKFLEQEVEAHPEDARRRLTLSLVAARSGNVDMALGPIKDRIASGTASVADRIRHAAILIQAGQNDEAKATVDSLEAKGPLRAVVAKLDGDIAFNQGDIPGAIDSYGEACASAGGEPPADDLLAGAEDDATRARLWRAHTAKIVNTSLRTFRGERLERRAS